MSMIRIILGLVAAVGFSAGSAHASLYTTSFGSQVPGYFPNDDLTFGPVALPFTFPFFGTNYNSASVSNNGNVQFGTNTGSYTPSPLNTQTTLNGIAPFWTDLDSRSDPLGAIVAQTGGSAVYVNQTTANQVVFTWDRLGYYNVNYSGRAQFQLVLNNPNAPVAPGEGVIGFFYGPVTSGTDTHNVSIGFGDGLAAINPGEISLFSGSTSSVANSLNNGPGFYWFGLSGSGTPTLTAVPEPATLAVFGGIALAGALGYRRRKATATA